MTHTTGPIAITPALARIYGLCRAVRLQAQADGARDLAANAGPCDVTTLELDDVHAVEAQLGITLPDEILAVLASCIPLLDAATGLDLMLMADAADRGASEIPPGWIALSEVSDAPFDPSDDGAPKLMLCVPRVRAPGDLQVLAWEIDGGRDQAVKPMPLTEFVRDQLARSFPHWEAWPAVLKRSASIPPEPGIQPGLTGVVVSEPPRARRVRHKVYGEGTVLGDAGDGKLRVEFDGVGAKVLVASFVTEI